MLLGTKLTQKYISMIKYIQKLKEPRANMNRKSSGRISKALILILLGIGLLGVAVIVFSPAPSIVRLAAVVVGVVVCVVAYLIYHVYRKD